MAEPTQQQVSSKSSYQSRSQSQSQLQSQSQSQPPPPAPPLPVTSKPSVLQRFIAPLAFNKPHRPQEASAAQSNSASPKDTPHSQPHRYTTNAASYQTDFPISAIDINEEGTHAVLAGKDILKIVRVQGRKIHQEFDIRHAVSSNLSSQATRHDELRKGREYLSATDVRWSQKGSSHIIATAAHNGRIGIFDISHLSPSIALERIHEHKGQVNKLDFDPHLGYMLLSGSQDKWCRIWDIRSRRGFGEYSIRAPVRDVRWSPTDAYEFALCTEEGSVQKWDIRNSIKPLITIGKAHEKACYTLAWHPDGKHIATGSIDKSVKIWDFGSEHPRPARQKPLFQLRCPGGIMSLAWRPPCWLAGNDESCDWQTTQIATSYTEGDPRVHVWDVRRPSIPIKELNQYATRPTDFLWASKDLLWTVGDSGDFVQNDMILAENPKDSLPPGAISWAVDGSFYAVTDEAYDMEQFKDEDTNASLLNIPRERLNEADEGLTSRSLFDEDGLSLVHHPSRRQSKAASARSAKSQANTPPAHDSQIRSLLPLDQAVKSTQDILVNGQLGAVSQIPGIYQPPHVANMVSEHYARPMAIAARELHPEKIIPQLENDFVYNASVARTLGLHDEANQWDLLRAVIIPELRIYTDVNRNERLQQELHGRNQRHQDTQITSPPISSTLTYTNSSILTRNPSNQLHGSTDMVADHGLTDHKRGNRDAGSNVTTPRQKALNPTKSAESTYFTLDDASNPVTPLPLPPTPTPPVANVARSALTSPSDRPSVDLVERTQAPLTERRAALANYRQQVRQPFAFDQALINSGHHAARHNSAESFQMFSASTSSSARARSMARHVEQTEGPNRNRQDSVDSEQRWNEEQAESSLNSQEAQFEMDESLTYPYGFDGAAESKPASPKPIQKQVMDALARRTRNAEAAEPILQHSRPIDISSAPDVPDVDGTAASIKPPTYAPRNIRIENPFLSDGGIAIRKYGRLHEDDPSLGKPYHPSDFRPINIEKYQPYLPWAISSYPQISNAIMWDQSGRCSQFSAHLLALIHPFFFDSSTNRAPFPYELAVPPATLAEKIQHPAFRSRTIQAIFAHHIEYLQKRKQYHKAGEFRKLLVDDFGYNSLAGKDNQALQVKPTGAQLTSDPKKLRTTCSKCQRLLPPDLSRCPNCNEIRESCPICEMPLWCLSQSTDVVEHFQSGLVSFSVVCPICGHSAHSSCLADWFKRPDAAGECPSSGCGCDCAPGLRRDQRIARQIKLREKEKEEREAVRTSTSSPSLQKDRLKAEISPAAVKARDTLRRSSSGDPTNAKERGTQSSDERQSYGGAGSNSIGAWSRQGTSAGRSILAADRHTGRSGHNNHGHGGLGRRVSGNSRLGQRVRLAVPDQEEDAV